MIVKKHRERGRGGSQDVGNHILAAVFILKILKIMPWHLRKMKSIKKVRKSEKNYEKDEIDMAFW